MEEVARPSGGALDEEEPGIRAATEGRVACGSERSAAAAGCSGWSQWSGGVKVNGDGGCPGMLDGMAYWLRARCCHGGSPVESEWRRRGFSGNEVKAARRFDG